uniref:Alpha/beta hydrolase n=1 Tax=Candidatus Kentrum sp. FW TaxID=2126338 RepID=A0A450SHX1_9GAMM|nr:MAG: Alpha/beta hydrolase of unknown function (DUF1100) [Candidatus Kentron sp. FW]
MASKSNLGQSLSSLQENVRLLYLGAGAFGIRYSDLIHAKTSAYDTRSWGKSLAKLAARYEKLAEEALDSRRMQSAREWLKDTVNYHYFSQVFLTGDEKAEQQARSRRAFEQLGVLLEPPCKRIMIPFMDAYIPGYLRVSEPSAPCVLLVGPGSDPTSKEVVLHQIAEFFVERGMSVFYFDGPGQGELVGKLRMSPTNFDNAISTVINFLAEQEGVANAKKIGMFAISLGAYFTLRAVAQDERIAACATLSGNFDGRGFLNLAPMVWKDMLRKFGYKGNETIHPDELIPPLSELDQTVTKPLLLIHGGTDNICVPEERNHIKAWAQGETEVWFYEDAEHICYSRFPEILPALGDWMAKRLLM